MKQIKNIFVLIFIILGLVSCQDEFFEYQTAADINKPVKTTLEFGLPRSTEIAITKANNDNSDVNSVRIYIFSGDKFLSAQTISNENLREGSTGEDGRHYTAQNVTLYAGTQTIYALGNLTLSSYFDTQEPAELIQRLDEAAEQGKESFLSVLYNMQTSTYENHTFPNLTSDYAPLSGMGNITVQGGSSQGTVELKRILSQIKFKINTTYQKQVNGEQHDILFTPQTYTFYNIPKKAYIMGGDDQAPVTGAENFYYTSSDPIRTEAEFEVYVPENIQKAKQNCGNDYDNREAFKGQGNNKDWTFAPDYGTYVILRGRYAETKHSDQSLVKYADVEYTIHLGDFSDDTGDYSNFAVERNNIYTYTITVQGVDKIIAEATIEDLSPDDYQNSAEGDVIELTTGSKVFNLDAHYEQVYVSYNLSEIARGIELAEGTEDDEIKARVADNFLLSIHTPFNTRATTDEVIKPYNSTSTEEEGMQGVDDDWVKFYSLQSNDPQLMSYAETTDETLLSPWQVCQKMGEAVYNLYKSPNIAPSVDGLNITAINGEYYARFTIFVNEYFYQKDLDGNVVAWDSYTNQEARTLLIASDMKTSDDLNSTYSTALTYLSLASIQTFYNADAAGYYNAMGLESYNENGKITKFGKTHAPANYEYDWGKGRANTLVNIAGREDIDNVGDYSSNVLWDTYINWNQIGYTDDNTVSGNKITGITGQSETAYYACLSRNRDLNRNGRIDDNEVRWYLPALSQYLRIGIGTEALSANARLYNGIKGNMVAGSYPNNYIDDGALYFMSNEDRNYYWAVEMGAYGSYNNYKDVGGQIRCVRNLANLKMVEQAGDGDVSVGKDAWAGPVYGALTYIETGSGYNTKRNYVFSFGDRLIPSIFRSQIQTVPYPSHDETDAENHLPAAFVVARDYLRRWHEGSGWWDQSGWTGDYTQYSGNVVYSSRTDPCRNYYTEEGDGDNTYWRTPNLSELMVMSTEAETLGLNRNTLCCTQFSNQDVRIGFIYQVGSNNMITAGDQGVTPTAYIRCVRDASPSEIEEANRNMPDLEESVGN